MAVDPDKPFNREEMYLAKAAGEGTTVPDEPWSRKEAYLDKVSGRMDDMEDQIAALATDLSFKGSVASEADLPTDAATGDTYITEDTGVMYVWAGTDWVALGGTGINVVQTTGTSQTDVMSQDATTKMVFADPSTRRRVQIGDNNTGASGSNSVAIGSATNARGSYSQAIGNGAAANGAGGIAIGSNCVEYDVATGGVAIGAYSKAQVSGQFDIGSTNTSYGYNNTNYRLITGVHDPQSAHDAATKGYIDGLVIKNAGAPTASTIGAVGMLLEDTTNGKLYQCTAVTPGTDPDPDTYTWSEIGGGGAGPTVVQTTGTSTTDVMSQNAVTSMVFNDPSTRRQVRIGGNNTYSTGSNGVAIGSAADAHGDYAVAVHGSAWGSRSIAIGNNSITNDTTAGSVAIGAYSYATSTGQFDIGSYSTSYGYNNSNYRLLTGVYDPQTDHDAATKGYVDSHKGTIKLYTDQDFMNDGAFSSKPLYKDKALTTKITGLEFYNAIDNGSSIMLCYVNEEDDYQEGILANDYIAPFTVSGNTFSSQPQIYFSVGGSDMALTFTGNPSSTDSFELTME